MSIEKSIAQAKQVSFQMSEMDIEMRNTALSNIAKKLREHSQEIFAANESDVAEAIHAEIAAPILKRLKFDFGKLEEVIAGIESLVSLPDPLFRQLFKRQLDRDLILQKETVPIGVIGVIFESRPDALVQIATLCLKSSNCVILKGGSEAAKTNRILFDLIVEAASECGIPAGCFTLLETRSEISEILKFDQYIDLLIPRGSNSFVQYIMENSKIPVMGHADGICHIYVDQEADLEMALKVIVDAKTQYVAACNTVETILVHSAIAPLFLPVLKAEFEDHQITMKGCERTSQIASCALAENFDTEYLDYIAAVKVVDSLKEAIDHINLHGSHHTDSILTERKETAEKFMRLVDSAGVYHNCSTRFADGYRYGFGAEVGISTSKLHARGPVGLDGLVTYKYRLTGKGHIVDDYAKGVRHFDFKELK